MERCQVIKVLIHVCEAVIITSVLLSHGKRLFIEISLNKPAYASFFFRVTSSSGLIL